MWQPQFSNFFQRGVGFEGDYYSTNEHAYQAAKTLDATERSRIRQAATPGQAKRLGGPKSKGGIVTLRPDWESIKYDVMLALVRQKFNINADLKAVLLATGDQDIVEDNHHHDNIWGNCLCPKCAGIVGQNLLGKAIMAVRAELLAPAAVATVPAPSADPVKPMRLLIAGSRTFADYEYLAKMLDAVTSKVKAHITVICGDAKGADQLGATWAYLNGHDVEHYPANWEVLGRGAGMVRNREMVKTATHACYFWDGKSAGTKGCIAEAKAKGIPIRIWIVDAA